MHSFEVKVRSYEIDGYGHVNNAVYQQWFEEGRERFLKTKDRDYDWYPRELGLMVVVARNEIDFLIGAKRGDEVMVTTRLEAIGNKSFTFRHQVIRTDGALLVQGRTVMCFAQAGRSVMVPNDFRDLYIPEPEAIPGA